MSTSSFVGEMVSMLVGFNEREAMVEDVLRLAYQGSPPKSCCIPRFSRYEAEPDNMVL